MARAKDWSGGQLPKRGPGVNAAIRRKLLEINASLPPRMGLSVMGEDGDMAALHGSKSHRVTVSRFLDGQRVWRTLPMTPGVALGWLCGFELGLSVRKEWISSVDR